MNIKDFDYQLPAHLIAQQPAPVRTQARLLCVSGETLSHKTFLNIKELLVPGDVLVLNDTQVLKARLLGMKATGGAVEALLERVLGERRALFQLRSSKPLKVDGVVEFRDVHARCTGRSGQFFELEFNHPVLEVMQRVGEVPLPPYIEHAPEPHDDARYQTVFGTQPGAVAAPTAGLHFSAELLAELIELGIEIRYITLHVGAGTFQPVRGEIDEHTMHQEWYAMDASTADAINAARLANRRVVAVGTTAVRTLETVAGEHDGKLVAAQGETRLFIKPGYDFQVVDALITNFHLPKSTLMMLVCAFAGHAQMMAAYAQAIQHEYRFFSYGDACWLEKNV